MIIHVIRYADWHRMRKCSAMPRWLLATLAIPSIRIRCARSSIRCRTGLRRSVVLFLVGLLVTVPISFLMFSSWNVCHPDYDDNVHVQVADAAGNLSTRSPRRWTKSCLSPLTGARVRVNISLDSDDDLLR